MAGIKAISIFLTKIIIMTTILLKEEHLFIKEEPSQMFSNFSDASINALTKLRRLLNSDISLMTKIESEISHPIGQLETFARLKANQSQSKSFNF